MKQYSKGLCAALALTFALGTAAPVVAAPAFAPAAPAARADVIQVQTTRQERRAERRENRRERRAERRDNRRERRAERREDRREARFERRNGIVYYNGRRGYLERRPGYRYYNGYWFPAAAFIVGAIIGGAMNNGGGGNAHVEWCLNRYRSYRVSDNTFQPYDGPRRQCASPYS